MTRGRPRKIDPDLALEKAMCLFWKKGFEATSMNDLVQETGMAKPGLYSAFGDKEQLYQAALKKYFTELGQPSMGILEEADNSIAVDIRLILEQTADFVVDPESPKGCFVVNNIVECSNRSDSMESLGREIDIFRRKAFISRFEKASIEHELPVGTAPAVLGEFYAGQVTAIAVMARGGASRDALKSFIDVAMQVIENR